MLAWEVWGLLPLYGEEPCSEGSRQPGTSQGPGGWCPGSGPSQSSKATQEWAYRQGVKAMSEFLTHEAPQAGDSGLYPPLHSVQ